MGPFRGDFKLGSRAGGSRRDVARGVAATRASESTRPNRGDLRPPIGRPGSFVARKRLVEIESGILNPRQFGSQLGTGAPGPFGGRAMRWSRRRHVEPRQDPSRHVGLRDRGQDSHPTAALGATERIDLEHALQEIRPSGPASRIRRLGKK